MPTSHASAPPVGTSITYNLTTEDGLRNYLVTNGWNNEVDIELLSGGTANYVYRVRSNHGSTRIFKHAAPYLHSNKDFAFDPIRMDYEARALEILSPAQSGSPSLGRFPVPVSAVHAVRLLSYDRAQKLLCMEDSGSRNLKDAYDDPRLDTPRTGEELGKWVAALHICSKELSVALPDRNPNINQRQNNPIAVEIYRHSYNNLHTALSQYGHDPNFAARINEEFGSLLQTDDECVCHGDYWPGNVLVKLGDTPGEAVGLTVVDWEMTRRGTSATDVGQFAAEAFLLDRFRGSCGLLPAFLQGYAALREKTDGIVGFGKAWLRRMVVHWAVHVAFWPTRVEWAGVEETQQLVDLGVGVLKDVLDDKWEVLLESPLFRDSKATLAPIIARP